MRLAVVRERIARAAEHARRDPGGHPAAGGHQDLSGRRHPRSLRAGAARFRRELRAGVRRQGPARSRTCRARASISSAICNPTSPPRRRELFQVIQTVDSPKLARRLNEAGRRAGRHAGSQALRRRGQERRRPAALAGADRGRARLPQPAAARPDDHAAVVGGPRGRRGPISGACASWPSGTA